MEMSVRFLTDTEIREILQHIPKVICIDKREHGLSEMIREQQMDMVASILKTTPVREEIIPLLGPEIAKYWNRATVDPGTAVGTLASLSVSEPATQGKLKNFTSTGSMRSRSYNADRINEILTVVSTQRFRNMFIVFNDKDITYERVLREFRPKIVGMTLKKLIKNYEVLSQDDPNFEMNNTQWWDTYSYIHGINRDKLSHVFLRLHLDVHKLAVYKITLPMVAKAIKAGDNGGFLAIIHSPFNLGILDVFVLPGAEITLKRGSKTLQIDTKDVNTFIDNVLIPAVTGESKEEQEIQISGIKGIVDMIPVEVKIISFISKVLDRSNGIYDVYINTRNEALYGIPRDKIKQALKAVGCRIVKINEDELYYKKALPLFIRCHAPEDPSELLKKVYDSLVITLPDETKLRDYNNPLYQKLVYVYAEAEGNNLRDVLSIPGIDKKYTISNDLREVREVLGIQAARNFIVQELMTVIETLGTRIHQSHVMLIADCIARNHNLLPVNHLGTIKNLGPFTNMAFERAAETIIRASKGEVEVVSSVSTQIGTGRMIISGTGSIDILNAPEEPENKITPSQPTGVFQPPKLTGTMPFVPVKVPPSTTTTPNPLLSAVQNTKNISASVADILRRRQQVINQAINSVTPPTSCPLVSDTVQYTYSDVDVPIPLIRNHRYDLFDAIASAIGLYEEIRPSRIITPIVRRTLPLLTPASASSMKK